MSQSSKISGSADISSLEALLALITSGEGIPLNVRITPSDEIAQLRKQIMEVTEDRDFYKEKLKRCETYLMGEYEINERLRNYLIENGLQLPRGAFADLPDL